MSPTFSIHLPQLLQGGWQSMNFEPFRDGIELCSLQTGEPHVALLRYSPGASVPLHRHDGLETILVLEGEQSDEYGSYPRGSLVINKAGSQHSVKSEQGCVVLIQWEKPVVFL